MRGELFQGHFVKWPDNSHAQLPGTHDLPPSLTQLITYVPKQVIPSPEKPDLQEQVKLPLVFAHVPQVGLQLWRPVEHSSRSEYCDQKLKQIKENYKMKSLR